MGYVFEQRNKKATLLKVTFAQFFDCFWEDPALPYSSGFKLSNSFSILSANLSSFSRSSKKFEILPV